MARNKPARWDRVASSATLSLFSEQENYVLEHKSFPGGAHILTPWALKQLCTRLGVSYWVIRKKISAEIGAEFMAKVLRKENSDVLVRGIGDNIRAVLSHDYVSVDCDDCLDLYPDLGNVSLTMTDNGERFVITGDRYEERDDIDAVVGIFGSETGVSYPQISPCVVVETAIGPCLIAFRRRSIHAVDRNLLSMSKKPYLQACFKNAENHLLTVLVLADKAQSSKIGGASFRSLRGFKSKYSDTQIRAVLSDMGVEDNPSVLDLACAVALAPSRDKSIPDYRVLSSTIEASNDASGLLEAGV